MDFGALGERLPLILAIVALILLQFFLRRRRKPEGTHDEIVQSLLGEVKLNQAVVGMLSAGQRPRRLEVVTWQRNRDKLEFLDQPLRAALSDAYRVAEEFNQQLDTARKYKLSTSLANINPNRLGESLSQSQQGLEDWLLSQTGSRETGKKYPGMFDDWTGKS